MLLKLQELSLAPQGYLVIIHYIKIGSLKFEAIDLLLRQWLDYR